MSLIFNIDNSSSLRDYRTISYPDFGPTATAGIHVAGSAEPAWWDQVEERLDELTRLRANWDGRGSSAPNPNDVVSAIRFLLEVMRPDTPAPWIGPLNSGGLQLSWKHDDVEVEAVFDERRGELELLVAVGENEWEEPIYAAGTLFASVVDRLRTAELTA